MVVVLGKLIILPPLGFVRLIKRLGQRKELFPFIVVPLGLSPFSGQTKLKFNSSMKLHYTLDI